MANRVPSSSSESDGEPALSMIESSSEVLFNFEVEDGGSYLVYYYTTLRFLTYIFTEPRTIDC